MKKALVIIPLSLLSLPAVAEVEPKFHKLCLEAKDYAGCVRAMRGDTAATGSSTRLRVGLQDELGNACPAGYAYSGSGKCRSIKCIPMGIFGSNEPQLSGKGHTCEGRNIEYGILGGRASMRWGNQYMNTMIDPKCPNIEPNIGALNSCGLEDKLKAQNEAKRAKKLEELRSQCDTLIQKFDCSYKAYLDANPGMKKWAELNPEMAAKESQRLGSID